MMLGNYRLISRLGAGGMGEVWRAEDTRLLRHVAIKILPTTLASDPEWKERFLREARTIAQLNHPNIATIYAIEEAGDTLFIAMELVEGESLGAILSRGPLTQAEVVRIVIQTADALAEAHAKGIVHRDIKPDNILVSSRLAKVLDFGIAKQIGVANQNTLTQGGMIIGTPHYMSPEQALGREIDARTDIFSLGVVMHEALSGTKPFDGVSVTETIMHIVMSEPIDIRDAAPNVSEGLAAIVRRCLKKQPADRFASAEELGEALTALRKSAGVHRQKDRTGPVPALKLPATPANPTLRQPAFGEPTRDPVARDKPNAAPAEPARRPPPAHQPAAQAARAVSKDGRALIADDDPATRFLLGSILSKNGFAFDEVENGAEAVKALKKAEYRYVFVDLLMPRVDGWGVIDFIRSKRLTTPPRVFIVTGVLNQSLSAADQDVVTGLLYKPIDIGQVEKILA